MSFGPNPWLQTSWDGRAAMNFIGGGSGAGLIVFATLAAERGPAFRTAMLLAAALIGLGLLFVWLEIGRPLRAYNVFRQPGRSWMSREAWVGTLLLPITLVAAFQPAWAWGAMLLAALYLTAQANMLRAARGIPAWREPLTMPLLISSGLAEGAGLYWLLIPGAGIAMWLLFGALVLLRFAIGAAWYRRLSQGLPAKPLAAVNRAGHLFNGGSLLAMAIVIIVALAPLPLPWRPLLEMLAGLCAAAGGIAFKWQLVTQASFNQGFTIPHLPVRGVRR